MEVDCFFGTLNVIQDKNAKSLSYYCTKSVVQIDKTTITQLVDESAKHMSSNARICLHSSPDADFHEMIIVEYKGHYYRPHKHLHKGESCHIIEGEVAMFVFNDDGSISHFCILSQEKALICRVGANQWHTVIPITEYAVYHESKPGPYLRQTDSIYSTWAPDGLDSIEALSYTENLSRIAERGILLK